MRHAFYMAYLIKKFVSKIFVSNITVSLAGTTFHQSNGRLIFIIIYMSRLKRSCFIGWNACSIITRLSTAKKRGNIYPLFFCKWYIIKAFFHELACSIVSLSTREAGRAFKRKRVIVLSQLSTCSKKSSNTKFKKFKTKGPRDIEILLGCLS